MTRPIPNFAKLLLITLALIAGTGLLAYVAVGDAGVRAAADAERVEVDFHEWSLETDTTEVEAGPVTFAVSNEGEVDHELLVLRTETPAADLPLGISGPVAKLAGKLALGTPHQHISTNDSYAVLDRPDDANTKNHLKPGETVGYDVDLKPGSYALYCNLPGHYQRGQFGSLEVKPSEAGR